MAAQPQTTTWEDDLVAELLRVCRGEVLVPGDAGFEEACAVYLGDQSQRPDVVVRPLDAPDVSAVVRAVDGTGVPLAVKAGGHSAFALGDGGVVLDLGRLDGFELDLDSATVWAGTGITCGEYTNRAAEHGLVTGFGDTGTVGLGGIALGGGIGYLARSHGLTVDQVLAAEVVTADGEVRVVDAEHEPELFWALRGGGGNFGVVTRLRMRLHPLTEVTSGMLFLPATPAVLAGYVQASLEAPETLTSILNVMPAPPMDLLPEDVVGTPVAMVTVVHCGTADEAARDLVALRSLATPYADLVTRMPYPDVYPPEDDFHPVAATHTFFTDRFDEGSAERVLRGIAGSTAMMPAVQVRPLGGAVSRVPAAATAFAHRDRPIMVNVAAIYEDPADAETNALWARGLGESLAVGEPGAYVNFLADDAHRRLGEAYPPQTLARLRDVKEAYDPANVFRVNVNIAPRDPWGPRA